MSEEQVNEDYTPPSISCSKQIGRDGGRITVGGCFIEFQPDTFAVPTDVSVTGTIDSSLWPDHSAIVTPTLCVSLGKIRKQATVRLSTWALPPDDEQVPELQVLRFSDNKYEVIHTCQLGLSRFIDLKCDHFSRLAGRLKGIFSLSARLMFQPQLFIYEDHFITALHVDDESLSDKCRLIAAKQFGHTPHQTRSYDLICLKQGSGVNIHLKCRTPIEGVNFHPPEPFYVSIDKVISSGNVRRKDWVIQQEKSPQTCIIEFKVSNKAGTWSQSNVLKYMWSPSNKGSHDQHRKVNEDQSSKANDDQSSKASDDQSSKANDHQSSKANGDQSGKDSNDHCNVILMDGSDTESNITWSGDFFGADPIVEDTLTNRASACIIVQGDLNVGRSSVRISGRSVRGVNVHESSVGVMNHGTIRTFDISESAISSIDVSKNEARQENGDLQESGASKPFEQLTDFPTDLGWIQLTGTIVMNNIEPIQPGKDVYHALKKHVSGKREKLAVKLLKKRSCDFKEVDVLLTLADHPNIVKVTDSGQCEGMVPQIFIAMEYCLHNLSEYIENYPFQLMKATTFFQQTVSAIAFIHDHNIAHRDLKPSNILVTTDKNAIKVSDFGISRQIPNDQFEATVAHPTAGTEGFKAPETYEHGIKRLGYRADLFSLGICGYYTITHGQHPFGPNKYKWVVNILDNKHRDLSLVPAFPDDRKRSQLISLLERMLEFNPEDRPSAQQIQSHAFFEDAPGLSANQDYQDHADEEEVELSDEKSYNSTKDSPALERKTTDSEQLSSEGSAATTQNTSTDIANNSRGLPSDQDSLDHADDSRGLPSDQDSLDHADETPSHDDQSKIETQGNIHDAEDDDEEANFKSEDANGVIASSVSEESSSNLNKEIELKPSSPINSAELTTAITSTNVPTHNEPWESSKSKQGSDSDHLLSKENQSTSQQSVIIAEETLCKTSDSEPSNKQTISQRGLEEGNTTKAPVVLDTSSPDVGSNTLQASELQPSLGQLNDESTSSAPSVKEISSDQDNYANEVLKSSERERSCDHTSCKPDSQTDPSASEEDLNVFRDEICDMEPENPSSTNARKATKPKQVSFADDDDTAAFDSDDPPGTLQTHKEASNSQAASNIRATESDCGAFSTHSEPARAGANPDSYPEIEPLIREDTQNDFHRLSDHDEENLAGGDDVIIAYESCSETSLSCNDRIVSQDSPVLPPDQDYLDHADEGNIKLPDKDSYSLKESPFVPGSKTTDSEAKSSKFSPADTQNTSTDIVNNNGIILFATIGMVIYLIFLNYGTGSGTASYFIAALLFIHLIYILFCKLHPSKSPHPQLNEKSSNLEVVSNTGNTELGAAPLSPNSETSTRAQDEGVNSGQTGSTVQNPSDHYHAELRCSNKSRHIYNQVFTHDGLLCIHNVFWVGDADMKVYGHDFNKWPPHAHSIDCNPDDLIHHRFFTDDGRDYYIGDETEDSFSASYFERTKCNPKTFSYLIKPSPNEIPNKFIEIGYQVRVKDKKWHRTSIRIKNEERHFAIRFIKHWINFFHQKNLKETVCAECKNHRPLVHVDNHQGNVAKAAGAIAESGGVVNRTEHDGQNFMSAGKGPK